MSRSNFSLHFRELSLAPLVIRLDQLTVRHD